MAPNWISLALLFLAPLSIEMDPIVRMSVVHLYFLKEGGKIRSYIHMLYLEFCSDAFFSLNSTICSTKIGRKNGKMEQAEHSVN